MSSDTDPFEAPEVTDADIRWAAELLCPTASGFHGQDGSDPRQEVLKSGDSIDIAACPGSGKTTLLVAKLAILAAKWKCPTRGICVLSHTNEARRQIESKLGNTVAGRRLLSYPHFVDTIHAFVNKFLAVPWLRAKDYPITLIDDDAVERCRRHLMKTQRQFSAIKTFVENGEKYGNLVGQWIITSPDFRVLKRNGQPVFKADGPAAKQLVALAEAVAHRGFHRYDEMFVWAGELIDKVPGVLDVIRDRFPLLFIDEAQDNGEAQSAILQRIFMDDAGAVIRQRFGDANQAIFSFVGEEGASTDAFAQSRVVDLPNSHRFGQSIADLADPFGFAPCGLVGQGPKKLLESGAKDGQHTIFLFDDDSGCKVMGAYAKLLVETFSQDELSKKGAFWAVGQRHKPPEKEEANKRPHYVGHYCRYYDPEMSKSDPRPQTFVHYVFAGLEKSGKTGEACFAVDKIAEGILRLAGMAKDIGTGPARKHNHRYVLRLLEHQVDARKHYLDLVMTLAVEGGPLTQETWEGTWRDVVHTIGMTVAGERGPDPEVDEFLQWADAVDTPGPVQCERKGPGNVCCYPCRTQPQVSINIGSIHSVKGQNHMATLVLETFYYGHNLESLKGWLSQDNKGGARQTTRIQDRLKTHYVAMTRPAHLLCLAIKRSTFEKDGSLDPAVTKVLKDHGWQIECV